MNQAMHNPLNHHAKNHIGKDIRDMMLVPMLVICMALIGIPNMAMWYTLRAIGHTFVRIIMFSLNNRWGVFRLYGFTGTSRKRHDKAKDNHNF